MTLSIVRGTTIGKGKSAVLSDGDHINVANSAVLEYQSTPNSRFASDAFDYKKLVEPYYIITPKIIGEYAIIRPFLRSSSTYPMLLLTHIPHHRGTFAKVHVACDQRNPAKLVAVKIISKGKISQEQRKLGSLAVDMHKEIEILRSIDHPNIITILDVVQTSSFIYIFFDR
jgi:serine/threonine protein kinase